MNYNQEVLEKGVVFLQPNEPFTWSSGIQSPIYCDNRLTLAYPEFRNWITEALTTLIQQHFPKTDVIMGTATAGIPYATLLADRLCLPCGYVRGDAKKHGRTNQIEGSDVKGKNVVVVEDLISTGKSVATVIDSLRDAGANVLGVVNIFQYNMPKADEMFAHYGIQNHTISDIGQLLMYAESSGKLSPDEVAKVKRFIQNPNDWQGE